MTKSVSDSSPPRKLVKRRRLHHKQNQEYSYTCACRAVSVHVHNACLNLHVDVNLRQLLLLKGKLAPNKACDKYGDLKIARMLLGTHFRDANELNDRMPLVTAVPTPGITRETNAT